MMGRETFDLERNGPFKGIRDYAVNSVGVDFVRDIHKGVQGGTSEDSEIGWHDQREVEECRSEKSFFWVGRLR